MRGERDAYRREARFVNKDGATVVAHLATALVRDGDGKPGYVIGMAEDVTEQRQLEEQLRQSQKLEAIGRLAGGVAHDFNNMLTAIGGYTALALEQAPTARRSSGDLDEIRKATDRAALLTRQLLAFSRKQVLHARAPEPERHRARARVDAPAADRRGRRAVDEARSGARADRGRPRPAAPGRDEPRRQRARRDADGGAITIETANADVDENDDAIEPGRYVTLTVRDTGEGIDEATLRQIFEPFFTTKDAGKGTGLGLATVYGIVKQSGGYVAVDSELGVGSAFTIYLRRADGAVQSRSSRRPCLRPPCLVPRPLPPRPRHACSSSRTRR